MALALCECGQRLASQARRHHSIMMGGVAAGRTTQLSIGGCDE